MISKVDMLGFVNIYIINIILILVLFVGVLCFFLMLCSYCFGFISWDEEKVSSYECGFSPFVEIQVQFDIKFYLVALLFVVFDVEFVLIYP